MLNSLRHPRHRAVSDVSIGPQSEADAREFIAYRAQKRKDSQSAGDPRLRPYLTLPSGYELPSPLETPLEDEETESRQLGHGLPDAKSSFLAPAISVVQPLTPPASDGGKEEERQDQAMFSALEKPRVRYDVEVITKLVVYAGRSRGSKWENPHTDVIQASLGWL